MSELPDNNGKNVAIDNICVPCQRTEIIPIFPVRYALGQFDLDIPSLDYPSIDQLLNSNFEPVNGLVARLLRSGYVYIYIEDGAIKQADEGGDDLPSYKDKWHIFYYHSPNPDAEGNFSDIGGKFVKQQIVENDDEHLVYKTFQNSSNKEVMRPYAFIPPTCSKIYIAYSEHEWTIDLLDLLSKNSHATLTRSNYMQLSGTMLDASDDCAWPLQSFADKKPTIEDLKTGDAQNFKSTLERFVQEMRPPEQPPVKQEPVEQDKSKDDSEKFIEKLLLSAVPAIPNSRAKINHIFNETKNKIEVGKIVALYDPVGISQDLAAFHATISTAHASDLVENYYAYTMYQAIETQLSAALPQLDTLFNTKFSEAHKTLSKFEGAVLREQQKLQSTPIHKRSYGVIDRDPAQAAKAQMSQEELAKLSRDYQFVKAHMPSDDQEAAVEALNLEFKKIRQNIADNGKKIEKAVDGCITKIKKWQSQNGAGSIAQYLDFLWHPDIATNNCDRVRVLIGIINSCTTITAGLEASRAGKKQIDEILYPNAANNTNLRFPFSMLSKAISSFIIDVDAPLGEFLDRSYQAMMPKREQLLKATDHFIQRILVNSPKTAQGFAEDVRKLALNNQGAIPELKSVVNDLAAIHGTKIKVNRKKVRRFIKDLNKDGGSIGQWADSWLMKFYGAALNDDINVLELDTSPRFNLPAHRVQSLSAVAFLSVSFGFFVTGGDLKRLQSKHAQQANSIMGLSTYYYSIVLAEVGAFALKKNVDIAAAKATTAVLGKLNIPTNLFLNTTVGSASTAGKSLAVIKGVLKTTPIIGAFDAVINYHQYLAYRDRGDFDAAMFAGMSIAGGSLLVLGGITGGLGAVGVTAAAIATPHIIAAGAVLAVLGAIGKAFAEDGELETWVSKGFWGWNENWRGIPSKYLYWGEADRDNMEFQPLVGNLIEDFPAQLEIAKLTSGGSGKPTQPLVDKDQVKIFMHREFEDYYKLIYTPKFKRTKKALTIILPGFIAGRSELQVSLRVKEDSANRNGLTDHFYILSSNDDESWSKTGKEGEFILSIAPHILHSAELVLFKYHPQGKGEEIVINGEYEFGFFE